jgi:2-polyprenyl-3-methyl-5-hydroxy-6-metoxy-1,4-benzoquinol methylase
MHDAAIPFNEPFLCSGIANSKGEIAHAAKGNRGGGAVNYDELEYELQPDGILVPLEAVSHREEEYDPANFDILMRMQARHFWYRGRHRFLLAAFRGVVKRFGMRHLSVVDLGAGCGGWIRYLLEHAPELAYRVALADSSLAALRYAGSALGAPVSRYQVDLLRLGWVERWDVAFLLDVLEHIPQDEDVLRQVHRALRPSGLLLVTAPALASFWSYNDELVGHQRRYTHDDFRRLASNVGFELVRARYFMFFLSPLLSVSRMNRPRADITYEEKRALLMRTHRVPPWPVNEALALIFAAETPLGWFLPFPVGTSILGVFRKR